MVTVRSATKAKSLEVAVARFVMASTVSFLVGVVGRLIGVIARLKNGTVCGCMRIPPFLVGSGKIFLEVCLGLDVLWLELPELAVVVEDTGLEHDLKSNSDDLMQLSNR